MSNYDPNYGSSEPTWNDGGDYQSGSSGPAYSAADPYQYGGQDAPADATIILNPNHKPSFAWLVVVKGARPGHLIQLQERGTRIGRGGSCELRLAEDKAASTEHAKVYKEEGHFVIHDLASANGTFVNGEKVYHQPLQENDSVTIGQTVLVFKQIREEDIHG